MRPTLAAALLAAGALAGCGQEDDHVNDTRPAATITVTAAIVDGALTVSPAEFGAGPVRLIVTNLTDSEQRITFEPSGTASGVRATTPPIQPAGVATIEVVPEEGEHELRAADRGIEPATVAVSGPRGSSHDQLLLP